VTFIDDKKENIVGAEQLGIKGILFSSYQDLISELEKLGFFNLRDPGPACKCPVPKNR